MATSYSCYALTMLIKTEDANFIASYRVSSSIHKNDFYTKRKLIS